MTDWDMTGNHVITDRIDGPDLSDMFRLVEFIRANPDILHHSIGSVHRGEDGPEQCRMTVSWWTWDSRFNAKYAATIGGLVEERHPEPHAMFVGHDGMVYDANGEEVAQ